MNNNKTKALPSKPFASLPQCQPIPTNRDWRAGARRRPHRMSELSLHPCTSANTLFCLANQHPYVRRKKSRLLTEASPHAPSQAIVMHLIRFSSSKHWAGFHSHLFDPSSKGLLFYLIFLLWQAVQQWMALFLACSCGRGFLHGERSERRLIVYAQHFP